MNNQSPNFNNQTITNNQCSNHQSIGKHEFDLERRTFNFAERCRDYVKQLPKTVSNIEYGKQLIRASGSQAANYIEANESLSKKDFLMRSA